MVFVVKTLIHCAIENCVAGHDCIYCNEECGAVVLLVQKTI